MKQTFVEHYRLLKRAHDFILRKGTGNHKTFAQRLGVSKTCFYRYLDELKTLGAEIAYDTERETYFYLNKFSF